MNYGLEIYNQIKAMGSDMWAWGATKYQTFTADHFTDVGHKGGLLFKVSGIKHKGHVMVRVLGSDTYQVEIGKLTKGKWVAKQTETGIYDDMLFETIDNMVEGTLNKSREEILKIYKDNDVPYLILP